MDNSFLIELISLFVLFLLAAFFSGSETALIALSKARTKFLMSEHPGKAKSLSVWFNNPNRLLTTLLIGFNIVAIVSEKLSLSICSRFIGLFGWSISKESIEWVATAFVILVIVLTGEILPKIFAIHNAQKVALMSIQPLVVFDRILSPFTKSFTALATWAVTRIGGAPKKSQTITSESEIKRLITLGSDEGVLDPREKEMLYNVFDFSDTLVRQVMVSREKMVCINIDEKIDKIINMIIEQGYSRLPVYKNTLDNIVGVVYAKDLLNLWRFKHLIIIQDLIRPPYFIPPDRKVTDLLREFRNGKMHLAVVREGEKVVGLITMEDLIEEVFGEIDDEYDFEDKKRQLQIK